MKRLLKLLCLLIILFSCSNKEKRKYVDKSKYPNVYYDIKKSDRRLRSILDNITEDSYIGLSKYNGKYCLFIPCDMMEYRQIDVTADTIVIDIGEGDVMRIDSVEHRDGVTKYQLSNEFSLASLELKKIDYKRELYVGKFKWNFNNTASYYLFAKGIEIKQYPVIINACTTEKFSEFDLEFDEEDLSRYFK